MNWREVRTCSQPQHDFLDALTRQGKYADYYSPHVIRDMPEIAPVVTPSVMYGGAGGGGKSHALRTATLEINGRLRELGFPARWGVLFCRTYTELADRQIRHLKTEFEQNLGIGRLRKTQLQGLFFEFFDPTLGGFYLRNVGDDPSVRRGIEYDWLLIDELTQFTKAEYDDIVYQRRSPAALPFKSIGAATNPDGIGHGWVKQYWIDRDYSREEEKGMIESGVFDPKDFVFIPARVYDNPRCDAAMIANLQGFDDPMLVKARFEGSWDLAGGMRFSQFNRETHVFEWEEFENFYARGVSHDRILKDQDLVYVYGSLDYGTDVNAASAFYLHAVDREGHVWTFAELYMQGMYIDQQVYAIKQLCAPYPMVQIYCDPKLLDRESDGISRFFKFRDRGVFLTPGLNNRIEGWATMDALLARPINDYGKADGRPRWKIHSSCRHLIRFMTQAPRDEVRHEDVSHKFRDDHAGDSCRYMLYSYFKRPPSANSERPIGPMGEMIQELRNGQRI